MTETTSLNVQPRETIGKANRRLAEASQIPAVLYGAGRESMALAIDRHDFEVFMAKQGAGATLVELKIDGESEIVNAIIKEVQVSPVKSQMLHVDFLAIRMDQAIEAAVALSFVGDSEGVKAGGVLMQSLHAIQVSALPKDLPESIEFDITSLEIGDTVHASDIVAPAGVEIIEDADAIVCSVTTPMAEEEEPEEELELEEGEVPEIGEEDEEGAEGAEESEE